jgi:trigger factor
MINIEIKELKNSKIEIIGTIPADEFEGYREKAVKNLSSNIKIPGFRKGHVPEKVLVQKAGESAILEEMADIALQKEYPGIITKNKIEAIGAPKISITKIAKGNPLEFKVVVSVMPNIELADYKAIAKKIINKSGKKDTIEVTDKEIEDTIMEIRKMRAKTVGNEKDKDNKSEKSKTELPELDDKFVKTLGDFKTVRDFKTKLKENIQKEKEQKARDKKKGEIIENIIKDSNIPLPDVLVESELDRMIAQFKDDIIRAGGTLEEYMKHIKKSIEEIRKEWRTDAEKRAKSQLILNKIATIEKITAPKEEVEKQVNHLIEHYKDADPERARIYVDTILTNEKVFEFLEKQGAK